MRQDRRRYARADRAAELLEDADGGAGPAHLLRYEMVVSREPVSDRALVEIVDDVFLPLVTRHG